MTTGRTRSLALAAAGLLAAVGSLAAASASTLPPPRQAEEGAAERVDDVRSRSIDAYVVSRGLRTRTEAARAVRQRLEDLAPDLRAVVPIVGTAVSGRVEVPIVTVRFANTPAAPYPVADLQRQLFDGEPPVRTMSAHYREMSRDTFDVGGVVLDWVQLPEDDDFYAGPPGCNAICGQSRLDEMLLAALRAVDADVDFSRFDNNGPDNVPNSADDDGFVDFIAFVHPESGGECAGENDDIWSHRFSIDSWTGSAFETDDLGRLGVNVRIDDYVIMPAFACEGGTMIEIGVFSHEFGHAFGLPDLYDSQDPSDSAGIGGWGLMASGSWGGDGGSAPESPSHMTAWSKEFLGWVRPSVVEEDTRDVRLRPIVGSGDVVRVDYSDAADPGDTRYLLLEYRTRDGFDRSLVESGLLVTEVDNTRVQGGLPNNSVNGEPLAMGVNVVEADGARHLDRNINRADAGDVFPGSRAVHGADVSHAEGLRAALCNIVVTPEHVTLDVFTSRTTCPGSLGPAAVSPAEAMRSAALAGEEIVVEGVLVNEGTNYFTDRALVVRGEGEEGGSIAVTAGFPLESAPGAESAPLDLSDVLGKRVVLRGRLQQQRQPGGEVVEVLVVEEIEVVD